MIRFLVGLALTVPLVSGVLTAGTPVPYDLRVELDFKRAAGDQGLREEFELQLISQLRGAACFRSIQRAPENGVEPGPETLRLRIALDEMVEETVYDT